MDYNNAIYTSENRTAGLHQNQIKSVQAWKKPKISAQQPINAKNTILASLEKASEGRIGRFDNDIQTLNAYADAKQILPQNKTQNESFTFGDVVNTINPLHHIPLVGMAYREITGSKLHPMSHIIGGALYGGPIGAVSGTANAITQVQTGKDIGDHALSLLGIQNSPPAPVAHHSNPFPNIALSFAPTASHEYATQAYEKVAFTDERTAGNNAYRPAEQSTKPSVDLMTLPAKGQITQISLTPMPQARDV